jgi:hypothetical protein
MFLQRTSLRRIAETAHAFLIISAKKAKSSLTVLGSSTFAKHRKGNRLKKHAGLNRRWLEDIVKNRFTSAAGFRLANRGQIFCHPLTVIHFFTYPDVHQ